MKKNPANRYSKENKELIVLSIVKGELFLEEAMEKYNIPDRRTIIAWLRKHVRNKSKNVN
ncbi:MULTISPECIES: hypothetical protein [Sphingobacterium]|jgi:hypothetical protein|uniref:hypothetical protein n=1 Tax=Sphingobacterium TaxID=28453 RepID=UPI0013E412B1|nr:MULTISPECIES: hypothetical protein [Sphingobacterium]QIH35616.1 hypothetical protein G6053_23295 [Sphingobacterium sp. DR205]